MLLPLVILAVLSLTPEGRSSRAPDNGLGGDIEWWAWQGGVAKQEAKASGKPLMVVIHKSYCPACKSLKSWFSKSDRIQSLSYKFVMVNIQTDQGETVPELDVDGRYVPRVFFLRPEDGSILTDVVNDVNGNPAYKYFYYDEESLLKSMIKTLQKAAHKTGSGDNVDEKEL